MSPFVFYGELRQTSGVVFARSVIVRDEDMVLTWRKGHFAEVVPWHSVHRIELQHGPEADAALLEFRKAECREEVRP